MAAKKARIIRYELTGAWTVLAGAGGVVLEVYSDVSFAKRVRNESMSEL
jgi:hypothetical protein